MAWVICVIGLWLTWLALGGGLTSFIIIALVLGGLILFASGLYGLVQPSTPSPAGSPVSRPTAKWFVALGLIGFFAGCGIYAETRGPSDSAAALTAEPSHNPIEAWTICQQFVSEKLAAPATAKYPWRSTSEFVTHVGGATYRVENYVDSQNINGAMLRTEFKCLVTKSGERWLLVSLDMR